MECDACGSRSVQRREVEGHLLYECDLCGELFGDDAAIAAVVMLREGRDRGLEDAIVPLVFALEATHAFKLVKASIGWREKGEPPSVLFSAVRSGLRDVEKLLRSIELANRKTTFRWLVELSLQHSVVFVLRPRFFKSPRDLTVAEINQARDDLSVLARQLRRDSELSWWREQT